MKITVLSFSILLLPLPAPAAVLERIAVRVNDRILTTSELKTREDDAVREMLHSRASLSAEELKTKMREIRKRVIEDASREMLMLERVHELDITTEPAEVEESLQRMKAQNNIKSDEEFQAALASSGLTRDQMMESFKRNITIQRVIGREIQSRLDVTDEFLRSLYNNDKEKYRKPDQVRLSEILILSGPLAGERSDAKTKADTLRKRLVAGEDFRAIARQESEGGTKEKGGDLGLVTRGELVSEIDAVVFSLANGQLSDPVESKFGFHLLRVDETFPVAYTPFDEVKEKVRDAWQDAEFAKRLAEYVKKLRSKYYVKIEVEESGG